jgi:hypothetical protein
MLAFMVVAIAHMWVGDSIVHGQLGSADIDTAREFVLAVYPELRGRQGVLMSLTMADVSLNQTWAQPRRLSLKIEDDELGLDRNRLLGLQRNELLVVDVLVNASGRLLEFRARGKLANTDRQRSLLKRVDAHPKWSDEDVLQFLRANGAHVIPDQTQLPENVFEQKVRQLEGILGAMDVRRVQFLVRDADQMAAGLPAAELLWRVTIDTRPSEIKPTSYSLNYEPFEGKLIAVASSIF